MRALLVRAGALGDVLLLRRVVASLTRAGHDAVLMAPGHSGRALVGRGPADVTELIDWDSPGAAALLGHERLPEGPLRRDLERCAVAIAYTRSAEMAEGLRAVVPRVLRHDPQPLPGTHAASWLCRPLADLDVPVVADEGIPPCQPTDAERTAAQAIVGRLPSAFLAIHPGSGGAHKNWPAPSFAQVVATVSPDRPWLLVQGPADAEACGSLASLPGAVPAVDLPYRVLGAVLSQAGVYVGNDSGVSHLAAAWGAPTVVLFGPTDPGIWAPVGPAVRVVRSPTADIVDLPVASVLSAVH